MSGYFGILRSDGSEIQPGLLPRIAEVLRFRGSDGQHSETRHGVGTCFAYLATGPATQAAKQPVVAGENWLIGDIRLDARRQLIDRLQSKGSYLSPDPSDEELLLRVWQELGESSLQSLCGDFSFALWDRGCHSLFCARDFVGPRPFYYAHRRGLFCFSNTLAALRLVPELSATLDEDFVGEFLLHGYCADLSRTVYADIRRLPAGHLLHYKDGVVRTRRFLTLPIEEPLRFKQSEQYLEAYRQLLREAVQDRLPHGATALYLSGGLDSASVCAVASQLAKQRGELDNLKAFTVDWRPHIPDSEPYFATLSATHLGLAHQILAEQAIEPFAKISGPSGLLSEPSSEAFFSLAQKQCSDIARHSRVVLSGDGGDDILMGQSWPYFVHLWNSGQRTGLARALSSFIWEHQSLPPLRAGLKAKFQRWSGQSDKWKGYPEWLNPDFELRCKLREKWVNILPKPDQRHPIHPNAYSGLHGGYWSTVLESEDASNTHFALETRAPLLDLRILRFLLRIPPVPWCVNKELARRSMREFLPTEVLNRPKTPLLADPLEACLQTGEGLPKAPEPPPATMRNFVDMDKWRATLKYSKGYTSGPNLFSLAFLRWLKDVENEEGIK